MSVAVNERELYAAYRAKCEEKGIEPVPYEHWKGPQRFSNDVLMHHRKGDEEVTKKEAAKILGYKNAAPVSNAIRNGYLKADGSGGVTEESVREYKKKREGIKESESENKGFTVEEERTGQTTVKQNRARSVDWAAVAREEFEAMPGDTVGFIAKKDLNALIERKAKELAALFPDWERIDAREMRRFSDDTLGLIRLGALREFGTACIRTHAERKGLAVIAHEAAEAV